MRRHYFDEKDRRKLGDQHPITLTILRELPPDELAWLALDLLTDIEDACCVFDRGDITDEAIAGALEKRLEP